MNGLIFVLVRIVMDCWLGLSWIVHNSGSNEQRQVIDTAELRKFCSSRCRKESLRALVEDSGGEEDFWD